MTCRSWGRIYWQRAIGVMIKLKLRGNFEGRGKGICCGCSQDIPWGIGETVCIVGSQAK